MIIFSHISYKTQKSELLCGHWSVGIDIGTPHARARSPRGRKMPQNSENDISVFALLTRKQVVIKQFFLSWLTYQGLLG